MAPAPLQCPRSHHHTPYPTWLHDIDVVTCLVYHVSQTIISRKEGSTYGVLQQELQNSLEVAVHVSFIRSTPEYMAPAQYKPQRPSSQEPGS